MNYTAFALAFYLVAGVITGAGFAAKPSVPVIVAGLTLVVALAKFAYDLYTDHDTHTKGWTAAINAGIRAVSFCAGLMLGLTALAVVLAR